MAPKKAAESQPEPSGENIAALGIEAWELPKTLVARIAKAAVGGTETDNSTALGIQERPGDSMPTKFTKDATVSLVKGSTVFINYVGKFFVLLCSRMYD